MTVSDLAAHLQLPAGMVKEFMDMFAETRLVLPVVDGETYVLGRDPETIGIKEILDCVKNSGKKVKIQGERSEEETEIENLLSDVEHLSAKALEGQSLQGMILSLTPPELRD
jgi:DNA-binding IscR family transcriptional regulator